MNKDRRTIARVLESVVGSYVDKAPPRRVLWVVRDELKALADTERRSIKKMEPFKAAESTIQNYRTATDALEDLELAIRALEEDDLLGCAQALHTLANPGEEKLAPVKPLRKTTTRRRA